ncbi:MAG TPA: DUF2490 domain-containing protein [Flavisolibacter sp.]|nr:DUF2490 domain-containing protein [Flavisolibacter sp.]
MKNTNQRLFLLFVLFALATTARAQVQFSGWLASFNTIRLNNRFSLHFDGQVRSTDQWEQVGTILLRPGLNFHLNKKVTLTAGYGLVLGRRTVDGISSLLPEHRIWQQAILNQKAGHLTIAHRLRFEERFLPIPKAENGKLVTDGFNQAFRLRYFLRSIFPLQSKASFTQGPYLALQNEVFLNTGNKTAVNGKAFDQNRLYGALGHRFAGKIDLELGYMNQYTETQTAFTNNHIVQLAVYKRL